MFIEEKLQVQTAAERLNFINEYINNHQENCDLFTISYYCKFPCRSEKQVYDEIQSICYMGNLSWIKMQVSDWATRGKNIIFVLIENKEYTEIFKWIKEQNLKIEFITECSYRNFNYYKIYKEE